MRVVCGSTTADGAMELIAWLLLTTFVVELLGWVGTDTLAGYVRPLPPHSLASLDTLTTLHARRSMRHSHQQRSSNVRRRQRS